MTHSRSRVRYHDCTRPCCLRHPPRWHNDRRIVDLPAVRGAQIPRVLGIGVVITIIALIAAATSSGSPERNCGTPPPSAYRSAGLWYSGDVVVGAVDPYDPDCFPRP